MLGVTAFGLLFTPAFYTVVRKIGRSKHRVGMNDAASASDKIGKNLAAKRAHPVG
jgi:multidrug efflux pump